MQTPTLIQNIGIALLALAVFWAMVLMLFMSGISGKAQATAHLGIKGPGSN